MPAIFADQLNRLHPLHTAAGLAVLFHLLLALLLPNIDRLSLPLFERPNVLNVFLSEPETEQAFEQSLNQQLPFPQATEFVTDPSIPAASAVPQPNTIPSEASPDIAEPLSKGSDTINKQSGARGDTRRPLIITQALVNAFAAREAERHREQHPEELERFRRSFHSRPSVRRQVATQGFTNQFGDYYLRSTSSLGDICFVQRPDSMQDEFSVNIVYFYNCSKQPQGWDAG
ncbi:MAG: hypothetical protein HKN50_05100 [Gammaproteobacteria bacterium]|nr:hypothetical protein [Gammaproteobacteria bacterium]